MRHLLLAATVLLAVACGGESGPSGDADGHFTAVIDGNDFSSDPAFVNQGVTAQAVAPGLFVIAGGHTEGASSEAINLSLYNIRGPGTYAIGVGSGVVGGSAIVTDNGKGWGTDLSGAAGTVTITELSATRIKGTFSFTAEAVSGGATGTREVTNGDFDLAVKSSGSLPAVPDQNGSTAQGELDGDWNGSTVVGILTGSIFAFTASNTEHTVSMTVSDFAGAGDYALSQTTPTRLLQVKGPNTDPVGSNCCWGELAGTGTISITSATATRVKGTITATLPPTSGTATSDLTVNLSFDVGIPQM